MTYGQNRLDELLRDPMVRLVMDADKVRADELRCLVIRRTCVADGEADVPEAHVISACRDALKDCTHR